MKASLAYALALATTLAFTCDATACTTVSLRQSDVNLVAKNYDWHLEDGAVIINKRGLLKTAMKVKDETGTPATWKSKFGSVTFNQYGREFPLGGMNEAGLVVEIMAVASGRYPQADARPYVAKTQYRQYLLDNFATVKEVIESDSLFRVTDKGMAPVVHLMVSDRSGDSAVIEFIDGKRVVYTGETMPVKALSNTPYLESVAAWKSKKLPASDAYNSVQRFVTAADAEASFKTAKAKAPTDHAFELLTQLVQPDRTKWSIVYDIKNLSVSYRTASNAQTRTISLKGADFSCGTPVKTADIKAGSGDVAGMFQPYTLQGNRTVIAEAFSKTEFLKSVPVQVVDALAAYPATATCE